MLYPIELWDCFGDAISSLTKSFGLLLQSYVVTDWVKIRPQNSSIMVQFNTTSPESLTQPKNCQYE